MVVVGADVHNRTHTFVAVNEAGRKLGEKTVKAVIAGHAEAVMWAREHFAADVIWAIEDCRHLSARLERDLFAVGPEGGAGPAQVDGPSTCAVSHAIPHPGDPKTRPDIPIRLLTRD